MTRYINNLPLPPTARFFAYDGCHKVYILEGPEDEATCDYDIVLPIDVLPTTWEDTCFLRFISNWKLDIRYVVQGRHPTRFTGFTDPVDADHPRPTRVHRTDVTPPPTVGRPDPPMVG